MKTGMSKCATSIGVAVAIWLGAVPVSAQDDSAALAAFFSGQGCAIGPSTTSAAIAAGFSAEAVERFTGDAHSDPSAERTGDWVVLAPSVCQITLPEIVSAVSIDAPEVLANTSAFDAYEEDPGCYLAGPDLFEDLQETRGWDADRANLEYIRLLGAALISGDMAFYSDDPLRTPPGPVFIGGACADIPQRPAIERDQALLRDHFDAIVRANSKYVRCREGESGMGPHLGETISTVSGETPTNAFIGFEYQIIAMAASWYEGMSGSRRGTPRPPFCHFE